MLGPPSHPGIEGGKTPLAIATQTTLRIPTTLNSSPTNQALALEMPSGIAIATIDPRLDRCEVQAGKGVLAPLSMGLPLSARLLAEQFDKLRSIR